MRIYEKCIIEIDRLQAEISAIKDILGNYPEGRLHCCRNGKGTKWYLVSEEDHSRKYLSKKEYRLAKALAEKEYYSRKLKED